MKKKLGVSSFSLIIEKFFNVERFFIFQRACLSSECSRIQAAKVLRHLWDISCPIRVNVNFLLNMMFPINIFLRMDVKFYQYICPIAYMLI